MDSGEGSSTDSVIVVGCAREPSDALDVLQLAGTDVEEGADAVNIDPQAVCDELIVGAQGSQREPEAIGPRELVEAGGVHGLIVTSAHGERLSTDH
jgi:hypothetical protein